MKGQSVPSTLDVEAPTPRSYDDLTTHATERAPLLPSSSSSATSNPYKPARWQPQAPWSIVTLLYSIVFSLQFGAKLMYVPTIRVFEWILCHHYYNELKGDKHIGYDEDLPESICKVEPVQAKLNVLIAVSLMLGCIPALLTTIMYGSLADKYGRRPIFALSLMGLILGGFFDIFVMASWRYVPVQLAWISPIFQFIGGGEAVANMMFFAIANDVTSETHRSTVFLLGGVGALVADILAPSVSSFLMLRSVWLPILIGMGCLVVGTTLMIFVPETLHMRQKQHGEEPVIPSLEEDFPRKYDNSTIQTAIRSRLTSLWQRLHEATSMLHSLPIILLLITFIVGPFHKVGSDMFLRYISNRLHWPLREVGFLLSLKAFFNLLLVIAILPGASYLLTNNLNFTVRSKDLLLAEISIILLTIGVIAMACAPTIGPGILGMVIWTFGTGYSPLARSLITTLVDSRHVGRLFAVIAIIEILSSLVANSTLAALYNVGLKKDVHGLPYLFLGALFGVTGFCVFGFGALKRREFAERSVRLEEDDTE